MEPKSFRGKILQRALKPGVLLAAGAALLLLASRAHAQTAPAGESVLPAVAAPARIGVVLSVNNPAGGVGVTQTYPAGPAAQAGLRLGDVIVSVDGKNVASPGDLQAAVIMHRPGEFVDLHVVREGWMRSFRLKSVDQADLAKLPPLPPIAGAAPQRTSSRPAYATPQPAVSEEPDRWEKMRDPYLRARYYRFGG